MTRPRFKRIRPIESDSEDSDYFQPMDALRLHLSTSEDSEEEDQGKIYHI